MKKDFYMEIDEKYYKFVNLFSRFQNEIETYYRYYEWYKNYGDFTCSSNIIYITIFKRKMNYMI